MSSTSSAPASVSTCTGSTRWDIPIKDAACAVPNTGNYTDIMDKCCGPAKVTKYDKDCGIYCLAQEQSLGDLTDCFRDNGAKDGEFFCNKEKMNATATAAVPSASKTDSAAKETGSEGAAVHAMQPVSKGGLGVFAMLCVSVVLGAFA